MRSPGGGEKVLAKEKGAKREEKKSVPSNKQLSWGLVV